MMSKRAQSLMMPKLDSGILAIFKKDSPRKSMPREPTRASGAKQVMSLLEFPCLSSRIRTNLGCGKSDLGCINLDLGATSYKSRSKKIIKGPKTGLLKPLFAQNDHLDLDVHVPESKIFQII